ncbi:MAG: M28 family peptidase [Kofleriaceae bacterium]|nr:M28 family peptidase [Kofleriaceae bacterium]
MKLVALFAALAGACGEPMDADPDAQAPDGSCTRPALDAPWLSAYLGDVVDELASAPRATTSQRSTARTYLAAQLSMLGWSPQQHTFNNGINVYATIPATTGNDPEIIVGAHFDTVAGSPGANDNASGTAVVLAVARYLKDVPCRTAPVTVVLFDLEETGLFGSRAFAGTKTPAQVRAVHTIDQVAWDGDNDRKFELELPTALLADEYRAAAQRVGVIVTTTTTEGTDHQPFRERGFAAIGLTEEYVGGDTSPHRHQATDTPSTVALPYLELATKLTADVIMREVSP